jgi:DNA-binding CsgD family transcriptional regulator
VIEFASRQSRHLLGSYFGSDERGCIPSDLLAAVRADCGTVSAERDHRRLTVYSAPIAGTLVLQLVEEDVRIDLLTPRQREVIHRIALGETDAQVAMALGISTATVGKHLEQIYARLGVHTRTAAAALILQTPDPDSRTQPTSGPYALQANRDSAPRPSAAPRTTRG